MKTKIFCLSNFLSNLKQFCYSDFRSHIPMKIYENKNYCVLVIFWVISGYFEAHIFLFHIFTKNENFMKTKILYLSNFLSSFKPFCYSGFSFSYIHENFLTNLWKRKVLYLNDFWVTSNNFATRIFRSYIFTKIYWKIYKNKNLF